MNQGTEWGLLMKKNRSQKSRASVPLRQWDSKETGCMVESREMKQDGSEILEK